MNSFTNTSYNIELFNTNKVEDLEALYAAVYHKKKTLSFFKKKYNTAHAGIIPIAFIAYHQQIPVAFVAAVTCLLQCGNDTLKSAQLVDGMVHPQHRNKGLYTAVCNKCCNACRQNGIELMYGFPNQDSSQPTLKCGWELSGHITRFTIPAEQSFFKKIFFKLIRTNVAAVLEQYATQEHGLKSSVLNDGYCGVLRNENYLRYKKYTHTHVFRIAGCKIWASIKKNDFIIGDIEINNDEPDKLIETIKQLAIKLGCGAIHFQTCVGTSLYKIFSERFEGKISFPVIFKVFNNNIDIRNIKFTFADIDIF